MTERKRGYETNIPVKLDVSWAEFRKAYPNLTFVDGKLDGESVRVLVTERKELIVRQSTELLYLLPQQEIVDEHPVVILVDQQQQIQLNGDLNASISSNKCDTAQIFADIEPQLIDRYGKGYWVVYSDDGYSIFPSAAVAHQIAYTMPGGKLVCCLGYDIKEAFMLSFTGGFQCSPRW